MSCCANLDNREMSYDSFINNILSQGRFSFSKDDMIAHGFSPDLARKALFRYVQKGQLYVVRKGFYVIITPEFLAQGRVPELMFIDELMQYVNCPYYVSLLSAAALHGAGHQQPMTFFVTQSGEKQRNITNDRHRIDFSLSQHWASETIMPFKTRVGYIQVSTAEATMFDLVIAQKKLGLSRVLEVLQELTEITRKSKIKSIVKYYPTAISQRLGYMLDLIGSDSTAIEIHLKRERLHAVPFSLSRPRVGVIDDKWKIIINDNIATDL